jgi:hypothetical protein
MARKSHRASRTKSRKHSKRQRSQRQRSQRQRRTRRHQGGAHALMGAPLSDNLAGSWSSKMSMGQGGDVMRYRAGQNGGFLAGAPVNVIGREGLPSSMQAAAMTSSTMKAYADIAGLKDQVGGRRKRRGTRSKRSKRSKRSTRSKRSKRSTRSKRSKKQRGGSKLDFAPVSGAGMLLSDYSKTGLSPQWNSGVEFSAAAARQAM